MLCLLNISFDYCIWNHGVKVSILFYMELWQICGQTMLRGCSAAIYRDLSLPDKTGYFVTKEAIVAALPCDQFLKKGSVKLSIN